MMTVAPSRILVLGATGFIGSAIVHDLANAGHIIAGLARDPDQAIRTLPGIALHRGDLRQMQAAADWAELVTDVDIVINASGALQSGLRDDVDAVQSGAIAALAEAATKGGVRRFVQISAASADLQTGSAFMATKAKSDAMLLASGLDAAILRPGLVIGRNAFGGNELIRMAAAMPIAIAPRGTRQIQCVALSDVVAAVRHCVDSAEPVRGRFDLLEAESHTLGAVIARHRQWLGFSAARLGMAVPQWSMKPAIWMADALGWCGWRSPLRRNAIAALSFGVRGDAGQSESLLGHPPLSLGEALDSVAPAGKADRWHARLGLVYPLALASLVLLWLGSGILGLVRLDVAAALLSETQLQGTAKILVAAGSLADVGVALGIIVRPWLKHALWGSLALSCAYLAGSLWFRADLWLDPLAPMLKVLPAMMLSLACLAMADER